MPDNSLMPAHKRYAITGKYPDGGDNFGVEPFDATHKPQSEPQGGRKKLREGSRAISKPRGFHPEPDHGPFHDGDND
jgi:hypothetical protein